MFHDRTRIYPLALEIAGLAHDVIGQLPPGYGFLADQLRRAAASIPLNFAEGCGKETPRDRRRYFMSARGSAYEVAAVLDVGLRFGAISAATRERGHGLCDAIAGMLTKFR